MQAIDECKLTVIHYSGHGSDQDELVFQDDTGATKQVSKQAIVQIMTATLGDIQLVFFNRYYSWGQAKAVVQYTREVVGMNASASDYVARVFDAQLYASIGLGVQLDSHVNRRKRC